jgi:hypothetical protein
MRAVGNHRGARTLVLALAAGLVAFEVVLALAAGAVGMPGVLLFHFAERSGTIETGQGGETVVAKLPQIDSASNLARRGASAPGGSLAKPVDRSDAPSLTGLTDIPTEAQWDEKPKAEPVEPKAFDADSKAREVLPWDAVEPVPLPSMASAAPAARETLPVKTAPSASAVHLPARSDVETWVKAQVTEIKGEDRARPLHHFELWLDAPEEVRKRLVAVAYDFNTPAVQPQMQMSSEQKTGFRVRVGGLTCADKITVTLRFDDGRSQQVAIDGCKLLG